MVRQGFGSVVGATLSVLAAVGCSGRETDGGGSAGAAATGGGSSVGSGGTGAGTGGVSAGGAAGWGGESNQAERVIGRVVNPQGLPLRGARVLVDDRAVRTNDEGVFEVEGVGATYDLAVRVGEEREVSAWVGLSRRDPTVVLPGQSPRLARSVTVRGGLSGHLDEAANVRVVLTCDTGEFGSLDTQALGSLDVTGASFQLSSFRYTEGTSRCTLLAFEHGEILSDQISFVSHSIEIPSDAEEIVHDLVLEDIKASTKLPSLDFGFEYNAGETPTPTFLWGRGIQLPIRVVVSSSERILWRVFVPDLGERIEFTVYPRIPALATQAFIGVPHERFFTDGEFLFERERRLGGKVSPASRPASRDATFEVEPAAEGVYCFSFSFEAPTAAKLQICSREPRVRVPDLAALGIADFREGSWRVSFLEGPRDYEELPAQNSSGFVSSRDMGEFEFELE